MRPNKNSGATHTQHGSTHLHYEDEKLLESLAKRALGKKVHLSFFERQQLSPAIAKALDASGNLDLNEAANLMHQQRGTRVSPNVRAAQTDPLIQMTKAEAPEHEGDLARHTRYCKDSNGNDVQGRNCRVCKGVGFNAHAMQKANKATGANPNIARHEIED
jgi:hypothetical protein